MRTGKGFILAGSKVKYKSHEEELSGKIDAFLVGYSLFLSGQNNSSEPSVIAD
jgi:hypothetical protein